MTKLPKEYYTLKQAAKILNVHVNTIHKWCELKRIQSRKFRVKVKSKSSKGKTYYPKHELIGILRTRVVKLRRELKYYDSTRHWCNAQDKKKGQGRYRNGANYSDVQPAATDKQIRKATKEYGYTVEGMAGAARSVGMTYNSFTARARKIGAWSAYKQRMANYFQWDMPRIKRVIRKHRNTRGSYKAAAKELGIPYTTLREYLKVLNIYQPRRGKCKLEDVLAGKHPAYNGSTLKERLLRDNILPHRCNACGRRTVHNHYTGKRQKVDLQIEHINGNRHDHRLEPYANTTNIELLCGLCHPHTPFYMGKNIGRYKSKL